MREITKQQPDFLRAPSPEASNVECDFGKSADSWQGKDLRILMEFASFVQKSFFWNYEPGVPDADRSPRSDPGLTTSALRLEFKHCDYVKHFTELAILESSAAARFANVPSLGRFRIRSSTTAGSQLF